VRDPERVVVELDELDQATVGRQPEQRRPDASNRLLQRGVELVAVTVALAHHRLP
jgi:hypothetical protein